MTFTLIKGTFHIVGFSPDGDSVKFKANKKSNWNKLQGLAIKMNKDQLVQLRLEGIDALETHYKGKHQPQKLANEATEFLLKALGFANVKWGPTHAKVSSANDGLEGYILSRATEKFGRPVSFVFAGKTSKQDGSEVALTTSQLKQSVNYKSLSHGYSYPTYYEGLFYDLREAFTKATVAARKSHLGVWSDDKTNKGATVTSIKSVTDQNPIMPKIFRRLVDYFATQSSLGGFKSWLAKREEKVLVLSKQHFTHFDNVISVSGNKISLDVLPEDLVFKEK